MENPVLTGCKSTIKFNKNAFETASWSQNHVVAGLDEVGRGCLAGPLVTAAAIIPPHTKYQLLKDSKIMTPKEREIAAQWIQKNCYFGLGIVHNRIIDKHNIWQSTLIGMKRALCNLIALHPNPAIIQAVLVDAMPLNIDDMGINAPVHSFTQGEQKSSSIAAASIIAKVTRDRLMGQFNALIPGYNLDQHKGYGTKQHRSALAAHGPSLLHRHSFLKNIVYENRNERTQQQTFC